jgi:hypothetical protein
VVHTGALKSANKTIRQSVTLPATIATQVRNLAKTRRLSSNRMLVELIENGIETEKRKQQQFKLRHYPKFCLTGYIRSR